MRFKIILLLFFIYSLSLNAQLPEEFVYIKDEIPTIKIELRYFSENNFVGTVIDGYKSGSPILTKEATAILKKVQNILRKQQLSLKIYDGYRPQRAVNHFWKWAKNTNDTITKSYYYPNVAKKDLFKEEISKQDDFVKDCTIDTDLEILIPDSYVESIAERLSLYTRLDNCENDNDLNEFNKELVDRFGALPPQVTDLFTTVQCRWLSVDLGFEKMTLKENTLRCYFINRPDSPYFESELFKKVLDYLQTGTNKARLKQVGKLFMLVVDQVNDMDAMLRFLTLMHKGVIPQKTVITAAATDASEQA